MKIEVKRISEIIEYHDCPLRTDLNSCAVTQKIGVNGCPIWVECEHGDYYVIPDNCPLQKSDVTISLEK